MGLGGKFEGRLWMGGIDLGLVSGADKRKAETSIGGLLAEGHHPVFIDQPGQIYGVAQEVRISWKVHYNSKQDLCSNAFQPIQKTQWKS